MSYEMEIQRIPEPTPLSLQLLRPILTNHFNSRLDKDIHVVQIHILGSRDHINLVIPAATNTGQPNPLLHYCPILPHNFFIGLHESFPISSDGAQQLTGSGPDLLAGTAGGLSGPAGEVEPFGVE